MLIELTMDTATLCDDLTLFFIDSSPLACAFATALRQRHWQITRALRAAWRRRGSC